MKNKILFIVVTAFCNLSFAVAAEEEKGPLTARTEVSFSSTSGNSDTRSLGTKLEIKYDEDIHRRYIKAVYLLAEDDGEDSANKLDSKLGLERDIGKRTYALVRSDFIIDRFAGYDLRSSLHAGIGYELLEDNPRSMTLDCSLLCNYDKVNTTNEDGEDDDDYLSAKVGLKYGWNMNDRVKLSQTAEHSQELESGDRDFFDGETSLDVAMNGSLSLGLRFNVNHQSAPPAEDIEKTDTTFMTAFIWDY